ncbi:MAG TPA: hypothetical protein VMM16_10930 [Verrucomicrobiae bacterium]|nr:hypothetical protein [Verrucomicrobiae bacterium]
MMPPSTRIRFRQPERDYGHRPLFDKLGVKPNHRVCVVGVKDARFIVELAGVVPASAFEKPTANVDMIFFGAEDVSALAALKTLETTIKRTGVIWVVYPRGQKHIRERDVIAAGKSAGLVDNKVCRFSDTHTALRLVVPLARR